jgi:hypothetical protein
MIFYRSPWKVAGAGAKAGGRPRNAVMMILPGGGVVAAAARTFAGLAGTRKF